MMSPVSAPQHRVPQCARDDPSFCNGLASVLAESVLASLTMRTWLYNIFVIYTRGYARVMMRGLDATFFALADPTRRAILARLASGEASVAELTQPFAMSQPAISRHLKVLENAGLIRRSRDAQRRPCRIEPKALMEANAWIERYRVLWESAYQRLDALLAAEMAKERAAAPGKSSYGRPAKSGKPPGTRRTSKARNP